MLNAPEYLSTDIRINSCVPAVSFEVQLQLVGWNECLVQAGCTSSCGIMPCVGIPTVHHGAGCFVTRHCSASPHKPAAMWDPINISRMKGSDWFVQRAQVQREGFTPARIEDGGKDHQQGRCFYL